MALHVILMAATAEAASRHARPVYAEGSSQFLGFGFDLPMSMTPPPLDVAQGNITVDGAGGPLSAGGQWINVTTACTGGVGWWVGLFPASAPNPIVGVNPGDPKYGNNSNSPFTPPFVLPAPLKYTSVTEGTTTREWWVPNVRQPVVFVLFSGGTTSGGSIHEQARTAPLSHSDAAGPMHVRLARTPRAAEMRVSWTAADATSGAVRWGTTQSNLTRSIASTSVTYASRDLCGEPARTLGWWDPGNFHTAVLDLTGLAPGSTVFYGVVAAGVQTPTRSFRVPNVGPGGTLRAVLTADMGATTPDKVSQHWAEMDAYQTTGNMLSWATAHQADIAFNVGDLSYATGYLGKWETFMNAIMPISASMPYMVALGNHEQDWPGTGSEGSGDSGGECGVPTARRFVVDGADGAVTKGRPLPYWYSFNAGPVHFCMVNTEIGSLWNGTQMEWLQHDLAAVDRSQTPWIVVMGHRNAFDGRRDAFEDLMYAAEVDLTVAGHVHYARRSCPMYRGGCRTPNATGGYDGIVHVIAGNGGQALNNASAPTPEHPYTGSGCNWTDPAQNCTAAKKLTGHTQGSGTEFGMSYFEANATTLTWSFIGNNDSLAHYTFALHRAYPRVSKKADLQGMSSV